MTARVLAAIRSTPWAILPEYLEAIEAIAMRALDHPSVLKVAADGHQERIAASLAVMGERAAGTRTSTIRSGVGCIPIFGPIFPRSNLLTLSGATTLDIAAADLRALQASRDVRRILLVVDSPGGVVDGVQQFARMVAQSEKPVYAHVEGTGASAAYWIASAAREISIDPTARVGSIGVVQSTSIQEAPDVNGRRHLDIVSSNAPNKRPDPATEEGRASLREMIDAIEEIFIADVARGRGVTEATVKRDFGAGGTKTGKQAKAAGMVDRVEADGLEGAIRRLSTSALPAASRRTAAARQLEVARLRVHSN
ncbi:S49 family peptidase [Pedomonas sp. V897]|uniref:S49 family peptidase n=1 Tax=Pedomonas sp. V897 TaxID=3446482 RepID=UPI003EE020B3